MSLDKILHLRFNADVLTAKEKLKLVEDFQPIPKPNDMLLDDQATAKAVVELRQKLDISQKQLAAQMIISQGYLCDLEGVRRHWTFELFNNMKKAFRDLI